MRERLIGVREPGVGLLLRQWRVARRLSQLALATEAGISARHLGFVEIGRARPSREMLLLLAETLDVPLRERNALLAAAGYAPVYRDTEIVAPGQIARIRTALAYILEKHEPFPALVTDRHWNLLMSNRACRRVFGLFLESAARRDGRPLNTVSVCFDPAGLRPFIANWDALGAAHVQQLHREMLAGVPGEESRALLDELLSFPGVPFAWRRFDPTAEMPLLLPLDLKKGKIRATFLSSFTSFRCRTTPRSGAYGSNACIRPTPARTRSPALWPRKGEGPPSMLTARVDANRGSSIGRPADPRPAP